jgi:hypothetical protein
MGGLRGRFRGVHGLGGVQRRLRGVPARFKGLQTGLRGIGVNVAQIQIPYPQFIPKSPFVIQL